jgi:hypothetical protein
MPRLRDARLRIDARSEYQSIGSLRRLSLAGRARLAKLAFT